MVFDTMRVSRTRDVASGEEFVRQPMARRGVKPKLYAANTQEFVDDLDADRRLAREDALRLLDLCCVPAECVNDNIGINEDRHGRKARLASCSCRRIGHEAGEISPDSRGVAPR